MKVRPSFLPRALTFAEVRSAPRNFTEARVLPERTSAIALGVPGPIARWRTDFLFAYEVFPAAIIRFTAEWTQAGRPMAVGDIILQRGIIPPVGFGLGLEFAVRVCALIREEKRLGFAYETLSGHAESGVSEFYFEDRDGRLHFVIHTFSEPGHWTARLGKHVFTLPYQRWCTNRALAHVRRQFLAANPAAGKVNPASEG